MIEALPKGRRTCHTLLPTPSSVTEPGFGHKPSIRRHSARGQIHSHPFAISGNPKIGSANRNHLIFVALGIVHRSVLGGGLCEVTDLFVKDGRR